MTFSVTRPMLPAPSCGSSALRRPARTLLACVVAAALSACATRSDLSAPALPLPSAYAEPAPSATDARVAPEWWRAFGSAELVSLVDEAGRGSPTLAVAVERVTQAELAVNTAGASLFPSLSATGSTSARRSNGAGSDAGFGAGGGGSAVTSRSTSLSLGASYEVDLWGRIGAGVRGAEASRDASRYDLDTARLSLARGVADAYFQVLSLRVRASIARENLAIAERVLRLTEARYQYGTASALDVSRQRSTVLSQRAALLPLDTQARQTVTALALLLGRPPQALQVQAVDLNAIAVPEVSPGLPSELLTRRPDLASAEAQLRAASANIDAARAALLPSISLSASAGAASTALLSMSNPVSTLGLSASVVQTLFDGGRLRTQVAVSESARRALLETYRGTVYQALKDVEDALSNGTQNRALEQSQIAIRDEAQRALSLSERRYREGADDLSTLLDAQRTLFTAQDALAQTRLARLNAATALFAALGGGWELPPPAPATTTTR